VQQLLTKYDACACLNVHLPRLVSWAYILKWQPTFENVPKDRMTSNTIPPFSDPAQTWNNRFAKEAYVFGTEPNEWLQRHAPVWKAGSRILCVADGEGRNSVWLAMQGHSVDAFDLSEVGVAKAKRLAQECQVSVNFTVAGCDDFAWPQDYYDGVAAIFVQFADPALRTRLFNKMVRSLKPGGSLILFGYTPKQLEYGTGGPSVRSHLYTPEMLRDAFSERDIEVLEEYETHLTEGEGHKGRSAVIGMRFVKPSTQAYSS
jgi:SAM-dependent methyltransferase